MRKGSYELNDESHILPPMLILLVPVSYRPERAIHNVGDLTFQAR